MGIATWIPDHDPTPVEFVIVRSLWDKIVSQVPSLPEEERHLVDIENKTFVGIRVIVYDTDAECKTHCICKQSEYPVVWLTNSQ